MKELTATFAVFDGEINLPREALKLCHDSASLATNAEAP